MGAWEAHMPAGHSLLPIILNPMEASHRKAYGITSYLDIITSSITHHSSSLLTSLGVPSVHPSIRPTVRSTNGNKEIPFSIQFSLFFFYRIDSARSADSNHNSTNIYVCTVMYLHKVSVVQNKNLILLHAPFARVSFF